MAASHSEPADHTPPEPVWHLPARLRLELLAWLSAAPQQPVKMTYAEFLDWADEDTLAEWVKGAIVMTSPANLEQQRLVIFLTRVMSAYVETKSSGSVLLAPFQMKLPDSGREPDVMYLAKEHLSRLKSTYVDGPADLVVEVVSPESQGRDRGDKFHEYQQARIPEYWLLDPADQRADFYQLDAQGVYQQVPADANNSYHSSALPGFWIKVGGLWENPLPAVEDAVLQIAGQPYADALIERLRRRGYPPKP